MNKDQLQLFEYKNDNYDEVVKSLSNSKINADKEGMELFKSEIFFALLHNSPQRFQIVDKVIKQVEEKGVSYVLCKISDEARRFRSFARQVKFERYQATAFIRLKPIDQRRVLMGEFEIRHQTGDLITLHFMERFPQYTIMLIFGDNVYMGRNKEIYRETIKRKKIDLPTTTDEYEKYWFAFYKSQFIPERKNIRYLKRVIPKRYWKWVTELSQFNLA
jgi:probable DNA metabolism protein